MRGLSVSFSPIKGCGIRTEIYPEAAKMKKQMGYADSTGVEYVCFGR